MNPAMVLAQCIVGLVPWGNCIPFMLADMLGRLCGRRNRLVYVCR